MTHTDSSDALAAAGLLLLDDHRTVIRVDERIRELLEREGGALVGRRLDALVSPADRAGLRSYNAALHRGLRSGLLDVLVALRVGARDVPARIRVARSRDGWAGSIERLDSADNAIHPLLVSARWWETVARESLDGIAFVDESSRIIETNWSLVLMMRPATSDWSINKEQVLAGKPLSELMPPAAFPGIFAALAEPKVRKRRYSGEVHHRGRRLVVDLRPASVAGHFAGCALVVRDTTAEHRLRQAQKLESIGQLAAGIAHEINTPTQYIQSNVSFVRDSLSRLFECVDRYRAVLDAVEASLDAREAVARARAAERAAGLEYLTRELPGAIADCLVGTAQVAQIVSAMNEFSHPGQKHREPADVNACLRATLTVSRNEWRCVADVREELDPHLPEVPCFAAELRQVFLNLVVNAAHAIESHRQAIGGDTADRGTITVRTRAELEHVVINVADTGGGIPAAFVDRVFDPFFTTKEVGKGTGQGLAIAYDVVVNKHGGTISVDTREGIGTCFTVRLPSRGAEALGGLTGDGAVATT